MTGNNQPYCLLSIVFVLISQMVLGQVRYEMVVAQDGTGDFTTIQAAINASKAFPEERITIQIMNGIYFEKVEVYSWNNKLTLRGESREGTIIRYDDHFSKIDLGRNSTFHTPTLLIRGNDFFAENLSIENTAGPVGQAIALSVEADRSHFRNCRISGNQDTLYVAGEGNRMLFDACTIEGTTDFIFGEATAVFSFCEIRAKANSYITAASTPKGISFGLVFFDCTITGSDQAEKVYLGRPWRQFARTAFLRCQMSDVIRPEGWHNWSKPEAENTSYYGEYKCSGPGYSPKERVLWAHILTDDEAETYTLENILGSMDTNEVEWFNK